MPEPERVNLAIALVSLAQCALRVKGYAAPRVDSGEFGSFGENTVAAVDKLRDDANYHDRAIDGSGRDRNGAHMIDREVWKGLCSQDAYVMLPGGDANIRTIQRRLNGNYQPGVGLSPADGVVTPQLSRALIRAVQMVVGVTADGLWGDATTSSIPAMINDQSDPQGIWADLLAYGLYLNSFIADVSAPTWGSISEPLHSFANFMRLNSGGTHRANRAMISALFVSHGDRSRGYNSLIPVYGVPAVGIDLATKLNDRTGTFSNSSAGLSRLHIGFVGRYMQNAPQPIHDKELTPEEVEELLALNGSDEGGPYRFGIAPIWQTSANYPEYFTPQQGTTDAGLAKARGDYLGMPNDVTVYFAVDYDAFGSDIDNRIVPYFRALNAENTRIGGRPIGAYGPRAVCNRLYEEALATASYVGNLSYGWTGNLGQPMPQNWAIDQFVEFDAQLFTNDGQRAELVGVDQLVYSGQHGKLWQRPEF
ncbi:glycoside hydrolase domain-containing protein [Sediminivirga luteola]|uniref:glycoside hydrolase domain-containing protein n=1 Tax=Sediminivirga luteola TaxID=1774748 RepID=UPI001F570C13|nr:glycoside hydrolase domain-containing protein [Sediminivirga luteola]MCI2266119.1 DUF1906 domain-containing protein [Sediminivirga luteola]